MRYLITFSYDGTNFHGFESQPKYRTIENEINKVLKYINNNKSTKIVASGRTDKGVHAFAQTGHVDIDVEITPYKLKRAMNSLLPNDIHVINTEVVDKDFHARYMVKEKVYEYKLNMGEYNPIKRNYIYQFNKKLDVDLMNDAIKDFIGKHNFKSFTESKEKRENYEREIYDAYIDVQNDIVTFTFRGNGFIKYQIRNMVGLLIQIGLGKKDKNCVKEIIEKLDRSQGFRTAHPEGLYLVSVKY
ncbi:MAG: tRNA pseudouridine(38-40) synthase TruA [Bacilli bacterium]|nr:tRNA pseudouridine(38-40) synthase TruA [Bacilli bacterium]